MNNFLKKVNAAKRDVAEIAKTAFAGVGEGVKVAAGLAPIIIIATIIHRI
jgi:hypothetical protein